MRYFYLTLLLLTLFLKTSCKNTAEDGTIMPGDPYAVLYAPPDTTSNEQGKSLPPPVTNKGEELVDKGRAKTTIEDIEKSQFTDCDDIIKSYIDALDALKKGNDKPLKNFPLDKDPKIKICEISDSLFAKRLADLRNEANLILIKSKNINDYF